MHENQDSLKSCLFAEWYIAKHFSIVQAYTPIGTPFAFCISTGWWCMKTAAHAGFKA
jgi:hypothetical protein